MALKAQTPFVVNVVCACLVSGLLGALVALPSLRVRGDYFVIVTLAFQAVTFNVLNNWVSLTGGPMGLPGIPRPEILGWTLTSRLDFLVSLLGLCGLSLALLTRLTNSPYGRVLRAIREDEELTQSRGKNVARFTLLVFVLGAIMAAVAGVMYAHYITFIHPQQFHNYGIHLYPDNCDRWGGGTPVGFRAWSGNIGSASRAPAVCWDAHCDSGKCAANAVRRRAGCVHHVAPAGADRRIQLSTRMIGKEMSALADFQGLEKRLDGVVALDGFSMSVGQAEIIGLLGPNGAGKTTLLNVVTGFLALDRGRATFKGKRLIGVRPDRITNFGMSRTFQDLRLIRQLTVLQNVLLCFTNQSGERFFDVFLLPRQNARQEAFNRKRAEVLLDKAGLADEAGNLADNLSYGQQELLSLVCCLATDAELLLLDEPIAGIAPEMIGKILSILQGLPGQGQSAIVIEHNVGALTEVCSRLVFMEAGRMVCEGPPTDVLNDSRVIEACIK